MKFEELLMQQSKEQQRRQDLEDEVIKLRRDLHEQQKLSRILQCALHEPIVSGSRLSSLLPLQVWVLLAEVAMAEEEIISLETKVEELKMCISKEKKQTEDCNMLHQHRMQQEKLYYLSNKLGSKTKLLLDVEQSPGSSCNNSSCRRSERWRRERKVSLGSSSELPSMSSTTRFINGDELRRNPRLIPSHETNSYQKPNRLSEELMGCLIGIFLKLNRTSKPNDFQVTGTIPKPSFSCMNSRGLATKAGLICKAPMFYFDDYKSILDPYGVLADLDGTVRNVGQYRNYIQFTRSSLDMTCLSDFFPANGKLRFLMHKLCSVDISSLTYKQKLAFWINIYNACIMNAFLQHGLPSTPDHLLALMNRADLNVGGIVLNVLAIEHFILRHPYDSKNVAMDEKEMLLRRAYSLRYPEPNVTFALCRGSWSSPALRIYTAEDVVNELEMAKTEYLEASVGVTSKKKIMVPKLLYWHMQDFADNVESLVEWIYSQLPVSGTLKRRMMECLNGDNKSPNSKMVEIQHYESEFRYILQL